MDLDEASPPVAPEPPPPVTTPRTHTVDVVFSILFVVVHTTLALLIAFFAPFLAMGTDPCAYVACGDEQWVTRAIYLAWGGGALAVMLDVGLVTLLLARHRIAFYVPIVGCLVQFGIGGLVLQMASWAGPIATP